VHVAALRLVNFRSYCDASVGFGPGLNIVVGANATGKTNLLEGAWFALRAASPRTRREDKLVTWGAQFLRVELVLADESGARSVDVGYAPGQGKRIRWEDVDVASVEELRRRSQVFIFVPESLLLVKGSPARRRAHLDAFAAALDPGYARAAREFQEAARQRNAALQSVRRGGPPAGLEPWDAQFARTAAELGERRRAIVAELAASFAVAAAALAPPRSGLRARAGEPVAAAVRRGGAAACGARPPAAGGGAARALPVRSAEGRSALPRGVRCRRSGAVAAH